MTTQVAVAMHGWPPIDHPKIRLFPQNHVQLFSLFFPMILFHRAYSCSAVFSFLASLHTNLPVGFEYPPPFLAGKEVSFELALIDNIAVCFLWRERVLYMH